LRIAPGDFNMGCFEDLMEFREKVDLVRGRRQKEADLLRDGKRPDQDDLDTPAV